MRKRTRILCLLVTALIVFALFPLQASSATDYEQVFEKLTKADVKKYDKPLPKGGKEVSEEQIYGELANIRYKMPGKGKVFIEYSLWIHSKGKRIVEANKEKYWSKGSGENYSYYRESVSLYIPKFTIYSLYKENAGKWSYYSWYKGSKTGYCDTGDMTYEPGDMISEPDDMISEPTEPSSNTCDYKRYNDAYVLGQKCFVYSYKFNDDQYGDFTEYVYVSRKTGVTLKTVSASIRETHTNISFVTKYGSKAAKFFKPPANVKFYNY